MYLIIYTIYLTGYIIESKFVVEFFDYILSTVIMITLGSAVYLLFKSRWYHSVIQMGVVICTLIWLFSYLMYYPNDFFADHLRIPEHVNFRSPTNTVDTLRPRTAVKFELSNGNQPGMYTYYLWYKPKERGQIYLKAFEITENIPLSSEEIQERTMIEVSTPADRIKIFYKDFIIYEGDWGKPYGSKISVYFKPIGKSQQKRVEQNFIVEGWMR